MQQPRFLLGFALGLVALLGAACTVAPSSGDATATPTNTSTSNSGATVLGLEGFNQADGNFAVLVSDEENAIGDFAHLWIDISKIGVLAKGASGSDDEWLEIAVPEAYQQVDLTQFTGDDATALVQGNLPAGDYGKIFVYVDDVEGQLTDALGGGTVPVKLPSSKLQINQPFTVGGDGVTTFVFDITVIAAGNEHNGVKYILKPQVDQSGAHKEYKVREREHHDDLQVEVSDTNGDGQPDLVTVRDQNGDPVPGANVELELKLDSMTTDANGQLTFDVPSGATELKVKADNGDVEGEIRLIVGGDTSTIDQEDEDEAQRLSISVVGDLAAGAPVTLQVLDPNGDPVAGANVQVKVEIAGGITGDDGTLSIDVPDNATVEAEARTEHARGDTERTREAEHDREHGCDDECVSEEQRGKSFERHGKSKDHECATNGGDDDCDDVRDDHKGGSTCPVDGVDQDCNRLDDDDDNDSVPTIDGQSASSAASVEQAHSDREDESHD